MAGHYRKFIFVVLLGCVLPGWAQDSLRVRCLSHIDASSAYFAWRVELKDNYAYVMDVTVGVRVYDITNPLAPVIVGSYQFENCRVTAMKIFGDYLFLSCGRYNGANSAIRILDLSNPAVPNLVGTIPTPYDIPGIAASGNYLYLVNFNSGMEAVDISNPATPRLVGHIAIPDSTYPSDVAINGNYAYVSCPDYGMRVVDIASPSSMREVGQFPTPYLGHSTIATAGNYAYLSGSMQGVEIIDISSPTQPIGISWFSECGPYQILASGCLLHIMGPGCGFKVVDMRDPSQPDHIGHYNNGRISVCLAVRDTLAFAGFYGRFAIFDCSEIFQRLPIQNASFPSQFSLDPAYPNPFNATTQIRFSVAKPTPVDLKVYDIQGRLVETLVSRTFDAGPHTMSFDGSGQASGVYLLHFNGGGISLTQKLLLVK